MKGSDKGGSLSLSACQQITTKDGAILQPDDKSPTTDGHDRSKESVALPTDSESALNFLNHEDVPSLFIFKLGFF